MMCIFGMYIFCELRELSATSQPANAIQFMMLMDLATFVRICSMKMLYTKPTYCWAGVAEMMAPVAKVQLSGNKIIIAMPYQAVLASFTAKATGTPASLQNLSFHLMSMNLQDVVNGGGTCVVLKEGQFLWIPECSLIAEFNLGTGDDILTSLTWMAMTKCHCQADWASDMLKTVRSLLGKCCQPSEKFHESAMQAWVALRIAF